MLVYGARGWIGAQLCQLLSQMSIAHHASAVKVGRDSDEQLSAELHTVSPTHVLCVTGRTHGPHFNTIDYLDSGAPAVTYENVCDNIYSVVRLAQLCAALGIHMTYVGTAYTLNSYADADAPFTFTEFDAPNFAGNNYSIAKAFAERLLHPYLQHTVLNARITLPINFDMAATRNLLAKAITYTQLNDIQGSFT